MTKESILALFETEDEDSALEPFYQLFGPSVRSEYELDGLAIVDLDWEESGCVISFVDRKLDQIRLIAHHDSGYIFKGWMGDAIVSDKIETSQILSYRGKNYKIIFEFLDAKTFESLTISMEI